MRQLLIVCVAFSLGIANSAQEVASRKPKNPPPPIPAAAKAAFSRGMTAINAGDAATATREFRQAATLAPRSAVIQNALGFALMSNKDIGAAERALNQAVKLDPSLQAAHTNLALLYSLQQRNPEAITHYRSAEKIAKLDAPSADHLGRLLAASGDIAGSVEQFQSAIAGDPNFAPAYEDLGSILAQQQRYTEAIPYLENANRLAPNGNVELRLGVAYLEAKRLQDAVNTLRRAAANSENDAMTHLQFGRALEGNDAPELALEAYKRAAKLAPANAEILKRLSTLQQQHDEPTAGVVTARALVALQPNDAESHNRLGLALMQTAAVDEAITEFQRAATLKPQDMSYRNNLGIAYMQKEEFDSAIREYQSALEAAPNDAQLHYNLGLTLKLKDQLPEAITEFEKALAADPQLADAHYSLGIIYWQRGDFQPAAVELNAAIKLKPDYALAYETLGTVYKQMKMPGQAIAALRDAIRLQPDLAGAYTTLAAVLRERGDATGARDASQAAARIAKEKNDLQAAGFAINEGKRLLAAGEIDKSILQFQAAVRSKPDSANAHFQLGLAFRQKGNGEAATAEFQRAAELDPKFRVAQ